MTPVFENMPEQLLELALKAGASHAEVYQSRAFSCPVSFEANRLKQIESSQSEGTALRLWKGGCPGLAVAYGEVEPEILVAKAIAISQLNPPETIELAEARTATYPDPGVAVPVEKLIEIGKEAIATIRDVYPEVICSAELACETETTILANSQGLHCEYSDTSIGYFLGIELVRGEDFLGIYDGEETRSLPNPEVIIQQILQHCNWASNNTNSPLGRVPVIFTPHAATMFWSTITDALNGKRVVEGSSPWSERLGEVVVHPSLTLSQKPDFEPFSCPFDDEGTPTQTLCLLDRGRLEQFYSDRATARALGRSSTGNGFRPSLGRYPTPDLVNLIVEAGQGELSDLIAQIESGLLVTQILGGGADLSGDFSVNVDLGYRIQQGEIVGRIKDTMVAGNVYQALQQSVVLGGDNSWQGSCYTPSLLVEGLSVVSNH